MIIKDKIGLLFVIDCFLFINFSLVLGDGLTDIYSNCGGVFTQPNGVIFTPNFPAVYPTPIYCEWLIRASPGKKIVLYFTQNYMKDSIYISSYDYFQDLTTYVGKKDFGELYWEHDLPFLVIYEPYILIQFQVESVGNRHLRVIDHLLDVYGFNITYEIVDLRDSLSKVKCSVKSCSYLGNCEASADFSNYSCRCFDKFFGENCQNGPYCDPENGINLCSNGGRCKYFFGSLINQCECPDGYEGAYCERSTGLVIDPSVSPEECKALQCSHQCDVDFMGQARCYCPDGYILSEENNTCIAVDRYRFDVALEFQDQSDIPKREIETSGNKIQSVLQENGVGSLSKFEIHGFRNASDSQILEFHFYCLVSETNSVPGALRALVDQGHLSNYTLKNTNPKYEKVPELKLSEVMNYDQQPTLRDKMMTLVCAAKGSSAMSFRWNKDGVRIDTSLTLRNVWETVIPHTVHGMYISVLNIDRVIPIDQGMFTCVVEDFGQSQYGSVHVTVNNYPRVQLDPMTLLVNMSKAVTFKCLSPDDSWQQFTYEWFKNGILISSYSTTEYAEEMFPTGVRLVVPNVMKNAEYTCKVTNAAGSANVSAYVFVVSENETVHWCPSEYYGEVPWSRTSGGNFDIKRCPTEQGGYTKRYCECDVSGKNCNWAEPNFAKCQSLKLIHTYDEMELVVSGYQQRNLSSIFDDLHTFVLSKNKNAILYSGDMDMVAAILRKLISHMKSFPKLVQNTQKIEAKRLVDLMGAILEKSAAATSEEKREIMVGPSVIQTIHNLITGAINLLTYTPPLKFSTEAFEMLEEVLTEVPCVSCDNPVIKDITESGYTLKVKVFIIRTRYLPDILSYKSDHKSLYDRPDAQPISSLYSINNIVDGTTSRKPTAEITILHNKGVRVPRTNTTTCLKWDFELRNTDSGRWTDDGCVVTETHWDRTVCECRLPGHFIAAVVPTNFTHSGLFQPRLSRETNMPLLAIYVLALLIILAAMVIYLKTFRNLIIEIHIVYLSFVVSIVCATVVCLTCIIHVSASQSLMGVLRDLLTYFYYVASSAIILEVLQIVLLTNKVQTIQMTRLKFAVACWGVPVVFLIPMVVVSKTAGSHDYTCHAICWLYTNTILFTVFVFTMCIHFIIYIVLLSLCVYTIRNWKEEWRYSERKQHLKSIMKNSILYICLQLTMGSGVSLEPWSNGGHVAINSAFHFILCVLVLVIRCFLDKHIRFLCVRFFCGRPQRDSISISKETSDSKSFRAFMRPERQNNVIISREEDNVSKYYDEVNRTKYTKERKRELSFLLGSGSSRSGSGSGSGSNNSSAETAISYFASDSKETSAQASVSLFQHSGTDAGILIDDCSKSTSSVGASGSVKDEVIRPFSPNYQPENEDIDLQDDYVVPNNKNTLNQAFQVVADIERDTPKNIMSATGSDMDTSMLDNNEFYNGRTNREQKEIFKYQVNQDSGYIVMNSPVYNQRNEIHASE